MEAPGQTSDNRQVPLPTCPGAAPWGLEMEQGSRAPEPAGHGVVASLAADQAEEAAVDFCSDHRGPLALRLVVSQGPSGCPTRDLVFYLS